MPRINKHKQGKQFIIQHINLRQNIKIINKQRLKRSFIKSKNPLTERKKDDKDKSKTQAVIIQFGEEYNQEMFVKACKYATTIIYLHDKVYYGLLFFYNPQQTKYSSKNQLKIKTDFGIQNLICSGSVTAMKQFQKLKDAKIIMRTYINDYDQKSKKVQAIMTQIKQIQQRQQRQIYQFLKAKFDKYDNEFYQQNHQFRNQSQRSQSQNRSLLFSHEKSPYQIQIDYPKDSF